MFIREKLVNMSEIFLDIKDITQEIFVLIRIQTIKMSKISQRVFEALRNKGHNLKHKII